LFSLHGTKSLIMQIVTLPSARREELKSFMRRHHYSKGCPAVYQVAYACLNAKGKIQGAAVYGPPPYANLYKSFLKNPPAPDPESLARLKSYGQKIAWQMRMCAVGITSAQLDELLAYAAADLAQRGFWWQLTLTDPHERVIERTALELARRAGDVLYQRGFTGKVYHRNQWLFLGWSGKGPEAKAGYLSGFIIDGKRINCRQGKRTLTMSNVREFYPAAQEIRIERAYPKQRWATILASGENRALAEQLMAFRPQPYIEAIQPKLFFWPRPRSAPPGWPIEFSFWPPLKSPMRRGLGVGSAAAMMRAAGPPEGGR
jgi:hypothetical protein